MGVFRRLLLAALCAGLVSGVVAAVAHQVGTVPLILQAETHEKPAPQGGRHGSRVGTAGRTGVGARGTTGTRSAATGPGVP